MKSTLTRMLGLTAVAGALLLGTAAPAVAQSTIDINPGNVPTTAAQSTQNCDLGGGPYPGEDVWAFGMSDDPQTTGEFLSVTATFRTPNGTETVTIPTDGGAIVNDRGTSKAWIRLPAGWTLIDATALISGEAQFFVLTHTCAASGTPSPTPTVTPTVTPTATPTASPTKTHKPRPHPTKSHLPVTGTSGDMLIPTVGIGAGALILGVALVALRRRRAEG